MVSVRTEAFRAIFSGQLVVPGDADYDRWRRVWKPSIDAHPAAIARCRTAADVTDAIRVARKTGHEVTVRSGGHSFAGHGVKDDALMIDMSSMRDVRVDATRRRAVVDGGAAWGDVDAASQEHLLATTGADFPSTGVAGMTLGGGVGWLHRLCGLSCDNLLAADVVLASGDRVRATEADDADLLWALRGGGSNFGVVTSMEFQLHPVEEVVTGFYMYPLDQAAEVLRHYRDFCTDTPDRLRLTAMFIPAFPAPFVPEDLRGRPVLMISPAYFGSAEDAAQVIAPLRAFRDPVVELFRPTDYLFLQAQAQHAAPAAMQQHSKGEVLHGLSDELIDALVASMPTAVSPFTSIALSQLGGAIARVPSDATAFPFRDATHLLNIHCMWPTNMDPTPHLAWVDQLWQAARVDSAGGAYVNHLSEEGDERIRAAYGANYTRLAELKAHYDPENFFHVNYNITPST